MTAVRGYRWLTLDSDALDLRTEAQRIERGTAGVERYAVRIFQCGAHGTGPDLLVFEGQVDVAATYAAPPSLPAAQLERLLPAKQHDADLYSTGMFHGPRLRGVRHLRGWSSAAIAADLVTIATDDFFAGGKRTGFATDAGLLDAAGQLVGYWLSEQFGSDFNCFPFEVLSYEQYAAPSAPGQPVLCQAQIRFTDARQIEADFDLLDASGHTLARLRGWRDRYFSIPEEFYRCRLQPHRVFVSQPLPVRGPGVLARRMTAFPDEFLEQSWGIWGRVLAHLTLSAAERREYAGLPATGKHRTEWLLARIAAKDVVREWAKREHGVELAPADVALRNAAAGKLIVLPISGITAVVPEIAVAHSGEVAVAALGASGLTPGIGPQHAGEVLSGGLLAAALGAGEQSSLVS